MQQETEERYIAVTMSNGAVYHYAFQMLGRYFGPSAQAAGWRPVGDHKPGLWMRTDSDQNIEYDLRKHEREQWNVRRVHNDGSVTEPVQIVSWRRITAEEHAIFSAERPKGVGSVIRNALVDRDGRIQYDLDLARRCIRGELRRRRVRKFAELDGQLARAEDQGKKAEADAIRKRRQAWRDAPADPRIDTAQTIDDLKAIQWPE